MHLSGLALQNVQPNTAPAAPATPGISVTGTPGAAAPPASQGGSPFFTLAMLLMFVPILFLMFRRNKKEQEARGKLKKGDRIVSQSGLVGELLEMDERFAKVKLGPLQAWRVTLESQAGGIVLPGGIGGDALRVGFVVGKGARVTGKGRVAACVVWPGALLHAAIDHAVVTLEGVVKVDP